MKIELFHTVGCKRCAEARDTLKSAAQQAMPDLVWREVDVMKDLDYAVEVGVIGLPALAVDGELAFSSLPTPAQLIADLRKRSDRKSHGR